jgi:hypothetical protein
MRPGTRAGYQIGNHPERGKIMTGPQQFPQQFPQQQVVLVAKPSNGLGVTGFVTGLLGLIFCWVPILGIALALLGVVFGGVGFQGSRKQGVTNGLAIAGLVMGTIGLVLALVLIIAVASA